ncbi:MAG: glycosyltransferase family 4 protein [Verrucomicrobiales bacterium]|nr:glycosyltransferase family 4 protein [Verrucomicrobiales bacterium]
MHILLLNQFIPPEGAPTAKLIGDLQEAFEQEGWTVTALGASRSYRGGAVRGWQRILRDLRANAVLLWKGLTAPRPDWVLCLSDPPGLPFTATVIAQLRRARLAHWAMDVYPEIAVALGVLPNHSWITRWVSHAMRSAYRRCDHLAGLDADMASLLSRAASRPVAVLPPWPPQISAPSQPAPKAPPPDDQTSPRIWLYSGNLGRAHDYATLLEAQRLLENQNSPWKLIFQGGGPARPAAMQMAANLQLSRCTWLDYVPEEELLSSLQSADVLIASQRRECQGLLWPSKLALMQHLDRPLAFIGPAHSAVADWIRARGDGSFVCEPGDAGSLADFISKAAPHRQPRIVSTRLHKNVRTDRQQGAHQWVSWLKDKS